MRGMVLGRFTGFVYSHPPPPPPQPSGAQFSHATTHFRVLGPVLPSQVIETELSVPQRRVTGYNKLPTEKRFAGMTAHELTAELRCLRLDIWFTDRWNFAAIL
jgi:hypothetical protein